MDSIYDSHKGFNNRQTVHMNVSKDVYVASNNNPEYRYFGGFNVEERGFKELRCFGSRGVSGYTHY